MIIPKRRHRRLKYYTKKENFVDRTSLCVCRAKGGNYTLTITRYIIIASGVDQRRPVLRHIDKDNII